MKILICTLISTFSLSVAQASNFFEGPLADQIVTLKFLEWGANGNSVFATGKVAVRCSRFEPLGQPELVEVHDTCTLSNPDNSEENIKFVGEAGDQISSIDFLEGGTTGNSSFSSGLATVSCSKASKNYTCVFEAAP